MIMFNRLTVVVCAFCSVLCCLGMSELPCDGQKNAGTSSVAPVSSASEGTGSGTVTGMTSASVTPGDATQVIGASIHRGRQIIESQSVSPKGSPVEDDPQSKLYKKYNELRSEVKALRQQNEDVRREKEDLQRHNEELRRLADLSFGFLSLTYKERLAQFFIAMKVPNVLERITTEQEKKEAERVKKEQRMAQRQLVTGVGTLPVKSETDEEHEPEMASQNASVHSDSLSGESSLERLSGMFERSSGEQQVAYASRPTEKPEKTSGSVGKRARRKKK